MGKFAVGQPVPRTEDPRLLRGEGRFMDDEVLNRMAHAYILRSPHAHARILSLETARAKAAPGVIGVFCGADWVKSGLGGHAPLFPYTRRDGSPMFETPRPALATDRVMHVGDCVALIVAESVNLAKDAAEQINVDYQLLPAVIRTEDAAKPGAPTLWQGCPDNECFFFEQGDREAMQAAFAAADHITTLKFKINRVSPNTMEPRGCIGEYDLRNERYILHAGVQQPFELRRQMAEKIFRVPEIRMQVVADEVGGSFGLKGGYSPEYPMMLWAAKELGRPVKWVCERSDGLASDEHDRDHVNQAALALDAEGRFLGLRASGISNLGAYLARSGIVTPTFHWGGLAGTYLTPAIHAEVSAVFTNTTSNGPYRGSGRPEASYILEQLIDKAAGELGMDRAHIRRINTIPKSAMPFKTGHVYTYDCGDFPRNLEDALINADYQTFEARRAEASGRGRLRGIGIANIIEQTAQIYGETVQIRFDPSGTATVSAGSLSHGQGHETMYKILVSAKLGLDEADIRVVEGDTDAIPDGGGTYASRTAVLGGSAATLSADKVLVKAKTIAAHLLEAAETDVDFAEGNFTVAGTDRTITFKEVARAAFVPAKLPPDTEVGLFETTNFVAGKPNFPTGCHIAEVEIDPETGKCTLLRYVVVDDVGTVINPLTFEGQIHGGIGQAVGQAFAEQVIYDEDTGQLLTGSFLDYAMPRADDMCDFELANNPVPTPTNPLGAKGAGEAGNVGGLAAIMNAVTDALDPLGVAHIDMPATPEKVWRAIRAATAG